MITQSKAKCKVGMQTFTLARVLTSNERIKQKIFFSSFSLNNRNNSPKNYISSVVKKKKKLFFLLIKLAQVHIKARTGDRMNLV